MLKMLKSFFEAQSTADIAVHIDELKARNTPDVGFLEQFSEMLVFIPDQYMKGHHKHSTIVSDETAEVCHAFTKHTYSFWRKQLGAESFPVALREDYVPPKDAWRGPRPGMPAKLYGELYLLPIHIIKQLDMDRENTVQYKRRRVDLIVPHSELRERPWFRETTKRGIGSLSRTERELNNPEEAELVAVEMPPWPIEAWMYVGVPKYWEPQIKADWSDDPKEFKQELFKPVNLFKTRDDEYYYHNTRIETSQ